MTIEADKTVLDNGVTVVTRHDSSAPTALLKWAILGGSQFEPAGYHGVGHFLEHVLVDPINIYNPLDSTGANVNAFTSSTHIAMHVHVMPEFKKEALHRILHYGLVLPQFGQDDFDREFDPIKQEITMHLSNLKGRLSFLSSQAMFGDAPLGHFICGTHADMDTHTLPKLRDYFDTATRRQGLLVIGVGNVTHQEMLHAVEQETRSLVLTEPAIMAPSYFRSGESGFVEFNQNDSPAERAVHMSVAFKAVPENSPLIPAFRTLSVMMTGGLNAPLFHTLRHQTGCVYSVWSGLSFWAHDGIFELSIATNQPKAPVVMEVLPPALANIMNNLTVERFNVAKNKVRFTIASSPEDPYDWAYRALGDIPWLGRVRERSEILDDYNRVSFNDVKLVAEMLLSNPPYVSAIGPVEGLALKEPFDQALSKFYKPQAGLV